jgi:hypothetical protein
MKIAWRLREMAPVAGSRRAERASHFPRRLRLPYVAGLNSLEIHVQPRQRAALTREQLN